MALSDKERLAVIETDVKHLLRTTKENREEIREGLQSLNNKFELFSDNLMKRLDGTYAKKEELRMLEEVVSGKAEDSNLQNLRDDVRINANDVKSMLRQWGPPTVIITIIQLVFQYAL